MENTSSQNLLHKSSRQLNPSQKTKLASCWKFASLMGLKKVYNKTEFYHHMGKVKDVSSLYLILAKLHDTYQVHESDIETVTDMGIHLKADIERAESLSNKSALNSIQDDYDRNDVLLEEHQSDRRKVVAKVIAELDKLSFPKQD